LRFFSLTVSFSNPVLIIALNSVDNESSCQYSSPSPWLGSSSDLYAGCDAGVSQGLDI
jgi:hypothetical protein